MVHCVYVTQNPVILAFLCYTSGWVTLNKIIKYRWVRKKTVGVIDFCA